MNNKDSKLSKLFDPNGKLMSILGIVADHIILSLLWLVCSLPIITLGAASAAMCDLSEQTLNGEGRQLLRGFFGAVKKHFKTATGLWLAILSVCILFVLDFLFYVWATGNSTLASVLMGVLLLMGAVFAICLLWVYPYLVRKESKFVETAKMSLILGFLNIGWSLLMLALDIGLIILSIYVSFLIPFVPGLMTLVNSLCIRQALRKYAGAHEEQSEE